MDWQNRPSLKRTFFYYSLVILIGCITVLFLSQIRRARAVDDATYEAMDVFAEVLQYVRQYYVTEVDTHQLIDGSIQGLFNSCDVDEDTAFLTSEVYDAIYNEHDLGDLGLMINLIDCQPRIARVVPGSPAASADIQPGDILIEIDNKDAPNHSRYELLASLRGEVGTEVTLETYRRGWRDTKEITLERAIVAVPSLGKVQVLDQDLGYIEVVTLGSKVFDRINQSIKDLSGKTGELKGLVLDLRNTTEGDLEQTIKTADMFLDQGLIVKVRAYGNKQAKEWQARADNQDLNLPLVVLINENTKQEAEVLAAALGQHKRAVLIGTATHGNATIEENVKKTKDGVMRVSVTLFETPDGSTFQGEGIKPHEKIDLPQEDEKDPVLERALQILKDPAVYGELIAKN